jgi:HAT1-interacting factor 1
MSNEYCSGTTDLTPLASWVTASAPGLDRNGPILSFSGDADETDEVMPSAGEDMAVDMFGEAMQAAKDDEAEGEDDEGDEGDDAEPEDDFNAAWEVLDLARAIYDKQLAGDPDDEVKLKLADTYITLGDVSLETGLFKPRLFYARTHGASAEKFDQAITDYSAGLTLKTELLPLSSRQIAEAHYKLSMVLDLTSGRLADAIVHAERALESVETRLAELRDGLNGQLNTTMRLDPKKDTKGKGKATGGRLVRDDIVQDMTKSQIEAEIKELEGLREDLALKV